MLHTYIIFIICIRYPLQGGGCLKGRRGFVFIFFYVLFLYRQEKYEKKLPTRIAFAREYNCSTSDKQTRGINTPQTMLVFVVVSQIFSAHSITVSKVLHWLTSHSKSLAPRTSFSEGKVRVYPQHPFYPATVGCLKQQPVFFSFGCVFFSLLC